jgi:rod shape-determining protein MreD
MRFVAGAAILVFFALGQTSALALAPLFGVVPNLVLLTLVAWTFARGLEETLPLYLAGGLALGVLQGDPAGLPLVGLALVAVVALIHELRIIRSDLLAALLVVGLGSAVYGAVHLGAHALTGERVAPVSAALHVLLPTAAVHVALFPLFFWTARGLLPERAPGSL